MDRSKLPAAFSLFIKRRIRRGRYCSAYECYHPDGDLSDRSFIRVKLYNDQFELNHPGFEPPGILTILRSEFHSAKRARPKEKHFPGEEFLAPLGIDI